MSVSQSKEIIEYPERDGRPMGETDVHIDWIIRIRDILRHRYRDQRVYVGSNLLVYYQEGDPRKVVVPDGFVVLDCDPQSRRTFKIWEEGRLPNVVFEVTSRSSRQEDKKEKPETYARIGVHEYFLFDPLGEYLDPSLQGFRLQKGAYQPIGPDPTGAIECAELDLVFRLVDGRLVMYDRRSGEELLTQAQSAEAGRQAEKKARQAAEAAQRAEQKARQEAEADRQEAEAGRQAAEQRAAALEAELRRLREESSGKDRENL